MNFYQRFILHAAECQLHLTDIVCGNPRKLTLTDATLVEFSENKSSLARTTHPNSSAALSLAIGASDYAIGAVTQRLAIGI